MADPRRVTLRCPERSPLHIRLPNGTYYAKRFDEALGAWVVDVWEHDVPAMRALKHRALDQSPAQPAKQPAPAPAPIAAPVVVSAPS